MADVPEQELGVDRPAFVMDGAGAALSVIPLGAATANPPVRIGIGDVRAIDRAVSQIYAHGYDHGSATLRRAASEALHTAYQWLKEGTYTAQRRERASAARRRPGGC
ncbi:hypothetical protein SNL152K_9035 [Streptomyces sp. NL15-2K]|nr:hypothetical protein SNL152K_9035 [Streptomyces sp. NL15-2K]